MSVKVFEWVEEEATKRKQTLEWIEWTHSFIWRQDNQGLNSAKEGWNAVAQVRGRDYRGLKRSRLVKGRAEKLEQALNKLIAEIAFITDERKPCGF